MYDRFSVILVNYSRTEQPASTTTRRQMLVTICDVALRQQVSANSANRTEPQSLILRLAFCYDAPSKPLMLGEERARSDKTSGTAQFRFGNNLLDAIETRTLLMN